MGVSAVFWTSDTFMTDKRAWTAHRADAWSIRCSGSIPSSSMQQQLDAAVSASDAALSAMAEADASLAGDAAASIGDITAGLTRIDPTVAPILAQLQRQMAIARDPEVIWHNFVNVSEFECCVCVCACVCVCVCVCVSMYACMHFYLRLPRSYLHNCRAILLKFIL
jgi:hypothetical protein